MYYLFEKKSNLLIPDISEVNKLPFLHYEYIDCSMYSLATLSSKDCLFDFDVPYLL